MDSLMTAVEVSGFVDENHQLSLDDALPFAGPRRVRVIVLYVADEIDEAAWLKAAAKNPAFNYLKEDVEDIYTLEDGEPFDG